MLIAGVMSGSSLDGLDIAIVNFEGSNWKIAETYAIGYSAEWEFRLRGYHTLCAQEYIALKYEYSHLIGQLLKAEFEIRNIHTDYISFHGHTLLHNPAAGYTEQIGNGGIIAGITGVPTITDFRNQDIVLGGEGTPLAPFLDSQYIERYDYYLNLGGIANITLRDEHQISAYDICPCNQILNHYSLIRGIPYDEGGIIARSGSYIEELVSYFSSYDYFDRPPPKSLDNNWIREVFIPNIPVFPVEDVLHTFCVWMAKSIADQINANKSTSLYSTGGGTHNTFFMEKLREALLLKDCQLIIPETQMIDFKEAILMAALAKNYLDDRSNVLSEVTGASRDSIGGALYKV